MALALNRAKVYLKLTLILAVLLIVLLVVIMNRQKTVDIWFFRIYTGIPVLWLILVTGVTSVLGWWGVRRVFSVLRELREVRRASMAEAKLSEQRRLAEDMADREKRIDEKVKRSISNDA